MSQQRRSEYMCGYLHILLIGLLRMERVMWSAVITVSYPVNYSKNGNLLHSTVLYEQTYFGHANLTMSGFSIKLTYSWSESILWWLNFASSENCLHFFDLEVIESVIFDFIFFFKRRLKTYCITGAHPSRKLIKTCLCDIIGYTI